MNHKKALGRGLGALIPQKAEPLAVAGALLRGAISPPSQIACVREAAPGVRAALDGSGAGSARAAFGDEAAAAGRAQREKKPPCAADRGARIRGPAGKTRESERRFHARC